MKGTPAAASARVAGVIEADDADPDDAARAGVRVGGVLDTAAASARVAGVIEADDADPDDAARAGVRVGGVLDTGGVDDGSAGVRGGSDVADVTAAPPPVVRSAAARPRLVA